MSRLPQLRQELLQLEHDRDHLRERGIRTTRLDRLIEAKRHTYARLVELAADLGPQAARYGLVDPLEVGR